MRYCKKCGAALNDEMLFCQKCGTKCDAEQPKAAYAVLDDVDINAPAPKKNKNSQGSRTVATVIVVFLIVVLVIILGVRGCSTNPSGNEDQSFRVMVSFLFLLPFGRAQANLSVWNTATINLRTHLIVGLMTLQRRMDIPHTII